MRRVCITLFMIVLGSGALTAQDSTFRYASDPFATAAVATEDKEAPTDATKAVESYDSYASEITPGKSRLEQKAVYRAEQRQLRIESRRWYGHSPSRPMMLANPYMTSYSPIWVSRMLRPSQNWYSAGWYY